MCHVVSEMTVMRKEEVIGQAVVLLCRGFFVRRYLFQCLFDGVVEHSEWTVRR